MNIMKVGLLFFYIIWIVFGTPFSNNIKLLIFSVGNSRTDCWKLFKFPRTTYSCASLQSVVMKLLTLSCFLLGAKFTESQFGQPTNANPFVDQVKINHFFLQSWTKKNLATDAGGSYNGQQWNLISWWWTIHSCCGSFHFQTRTSATGDRWLIIINNN